MKKIPLSFLAAILIATVLPGMLPNKPSEVFAQTNQPAHLALLFIIDDSGSMQENDPANLRYTAVQLMIAALDEGDAVGGIRFATTAQPITHGMVTLSGPKDKSLLIDAFQPVKAEGYTDVKAAFSLAKAVLDQADLSGYRKTIILLTDGKPEIPQSYPAYEAEAVSIALSTDTPIDAIALTSGGQSSFLNQVTSQTGGKQIPTQTANDLLDSYLQLLSDIKDRTVFGEGSRAAPGNVALSLSPALMPYVSKVTFIVSKSEPLQDKLFSPDAAEISPADPAVAFYRNSDPFFSVITINQPAGGEWTYRFEGHGEVRVRAILSSRLRAKSISQNRVESGQPLHLTVNLIEEQTNLTAIKIIGEASFSALVTLPDRSQQSLDTFYDDGTHGDPVPGDGDYTRVFTNTDIPGVYDVSITGLKGIIPITTGFSFESIPFPQVRVDEPSLSSYEIRSSPIPLKIHLEGGASSGEFMGGFQALITAPDRKITTAPLQADAGFYSAEFSPSESGPYRVEFQPIASSYQGLPFPHTAQVDFSVQIIPRISLEKLQVGLTPSEEQTRYEISQAVQGIPILVTIQSSSAQAQAINGHLERMDGFSLVETGPILIAPAGSTTLTLHIRGDPKIQPGKWEGKLVFSADGPVELTRPVLPISLELFTPTVTVNARVISQMSSSSCLIWAPVQLVLDAHSNSLQPERLNVELTGILGARLREGSLLVAPGDSQIVVALQPAGGLRPGLYAGQLVVNAARSGVTILPQETLPVEFSINPLWISCERPLIIWGVSGFGLVMIGIVIAIKRKGDTAPAMVSGTLIHWKLGNPNQEHQIDLTDLKKTSIRLGKGGNCEITLPDETLAEIHAVITAERNRGEIQIWLEPKAKVQKGYQTYTTPIPLEEQVIYQIGKTNFKFIRDAKI